MCFQIFKLLTDLLFFSPSMCVLVVLPRSLGPRNITEVLEIGTIIQKKYGDKREAHREIKKMARVLPPPAPLAPVYYCELQE